MSDSSGENRPAGAPPIPAAIAKQAPGVRSAKQAPVGGTTLQTGDVIGGKFVVSRYLGSSDGAVSYMCRDEKRERDCVIKVIDVSTMPAVIQKHLNEEVPRAARLQHRNLTSLYGMGQVDATHIFVAMEYVHGNSLARVLTQRRELGRMLSMRDIFTVLAHLVNTVEQIHAAGLVHAVLTPYNISLSRRGVVKVSNLVFGRATSAAMLPLGLGPFTDSVYVAPEVSRDPTSASPASDVYSIAMICVELISRKGLPGERNAAAAEVSGSLSSYPTRFKQLILRSISSDPAKRPETPAMLRDMFEEIAREKGVKLGLPPGEGELPIEPAVPPEVEHSSDAEDVDLFDLPGLDAPSHQGFGGIVFEEEEEEDGRYLVQKGGLDYGPFTEAQVLEQLYADEISESTQILDRISQERVRLEDVPAFSAPVAEYIPRREARKQAEADARAELQRKVKKGGVAVFVVGIAAGLVVLAGMIYVVATQPDPMPLPMDRAFASLDFKLLPPPKEFETVAVDKGVLQSIFNPEASEAEIEKQIKKLRKRRTAKKGPKTTSAGSADDENITEVNMAGSGGSQNILSDGEVNEVILGKWGSLRRCVMKEFQSNPNFKGVTVQFFIRPSGTTGGVKIQEGQYAGKPVGQCLVSRFRSMKFPAHGGFNKGVTFPLLVQ